MAYTDPNATVTTGQQMMNPADWLQQAQSQYATMQGSPLLRQGKLDNYASQPYLMGLGNAAGPATQQAGATLNYLLSQQGKTDPRLMNTMRSQIAGDASQRARQTQGKMARSGWGNSGLAMALNQSIKGGGAQRENDLMARQAQMEEDRKRQDLELFQSIIGNPSMDSRAMALGQFNSDRARNDEKQRQKLAMIGTVMGIGGMAAGAAGAAK